MQDRRGQSSVRGASFYSSQIAKSGTALTLPVDRREVIFTDRPGTPEVGDTIGQQRSKEDDSCEPDYARDTRYHRGLRRTWGPWDGTTRCRRC